MTKKNILAIIYENNENKEIEWNVESNTKNQIVITNTYDKSVRFTISFVGDGIKVYDNHEEKCIGFLIKGTEFYADFSDDEVGISQAVKKIVRHFYYCY